VSRLYSVVVSHNSSSTIDIINSNTISALHVNSGVNIILLSQSVGNASVSFMVQYLFNALNLISGKLEESGDADGDIGSFLLTGGEISTCFGHILPDGKYTWQENMTETLEQYMQNVTLSILSGQVFVSNNSDGPEVLEEFATNCNYTFTAYEYTPSRLFLTYGAAGFVTILCVVAGCIAIKQNGVDESMAFSRILRAVLNERMYNVKDRWDMDTRIKADNNAAGSFAPFLDSKI